MSDVVTRWLRRLVLWLNRPLKHITGSVDAWLLRREAIRTPPAIPDILEEVGSLDADGKPRRAPDEAGPIFVLGASWRCGTTLVQRMVVESKEVLVWGEPYARAAYVQRLSNLLRMFADAWPPDSFYFENRREEELHESWIACLYPSTGDLRPAHAAFFRRLFASPARTAGYSRWGLKEVRLDREHVAYLDWLFPDAKFVLLVRDPFEAYESYRRWAARGMGDVGRGWYAQWPQEPVFTPMAFGRHWSRRARGFYQMADRPDTLFLQFEDFTVRGTRLERLRAFLDIDVPGSALEASVGSTQGDPGEVGTVEEFLLRRQVEAVARELGY